MTEEQESVQQWVERVTSELDSLITEVDNGDGTFTLRYAGPPVERDEEYIEAWREDEERRANEQ